MDIGYFWVRRVCEASGGYVGDEAPPSYHPFLAGTGLSLSYDCNEAKAQVVAYRAEHIRDNGRRWGHRTDDRGSFSGAFKTREACVEDGRQTYGEPFWICSGVVAPPTRYMPDAEWVIERLAEQAYDEGHEAAEEFPDVTREAKAELDALLETWATRHVEVTFWVADSEPEKVS